MIDTSEEPSKVPAKRPSFKENWEKVDETCPHCKQVTKRVRGITRQNVKRLLVPQWNYNELFIMLLLALVLIMAFLYKSEVKVAKEWVNVFKGEPEVCKMTCAAKCDLLNNDVQMNDNELYGKLAAGLNGTTLPT